MPSQVIHSTTLTSLKAEGKLQTLRKEDTSLFDHQVAGHTVEEMRSYLGLLMKPLIKTPNFLREHDVYASLGRFGKHDTQSMRQFLSPFHGVCLIKNLEDNKIAGRESGSGALTQTQAQALAQNSDNVDTSEKFEDDKGSLHLVIGDQCHSMHHPCIIDLKMGTQTYEPTASISKKHREVEKCPFQSTMGYRLTGIKVKDKSTGRYAIVNKNFGRMITPDMGHEALLLCFYDGHSLRRDVIHATIQKLEALYLWLQNQNRMHFYCSSLLILYEGMGSREERSTDSANCSDSDASCPGRHFFSNLPPRFPQVELKLEGDDNYSQSRGNKFAIPAKPLAAPLKYKVNVNKTYLDGLSSCVLESEQSEAKRKPTKKYQIRKRIMKNDVYIKMIDFAHTITLKEKDRSLDYSYLHGLKTCIGNLKRILTLYPARQHSHVVHS